MYSDFQVFYRRPTDSSFEFVATEIVESNVDGLVVRFAELLLRDGEEIDLYHQDGDDFHRQRWAVTRTHPSMQALYVWLTPVSEPQQGSLRACDRISTPFEGILVNIAGLTECPVIDISDGGLALQMDTELPIDSVHEMQMTFRQLKLNGHVKVCSSRNTEGGPFRVGLQCQDDAEDCNLQRMLPVLTTGLQVKRLESVVWSDEPETV